VLIVVGGPQYRAGSHRQFTLLCRMLASRGIAAMRFDFRGMGDSEGLASSFTDVGAQLRAASDHFLQQCGKLRELVLWGLCDGASAALIHAGSDTRITGLVLLNPWVRTDESLARAYIKSYYLKRMLSRSFWQKLLAGRFRFAEAGRSLLANVAAASGHGRDLEEEARAGARNPLPVRMLEGWMRFRGRILLVLSENDLTADEFRQVVASDPRWSRALAEPRVQRQDVAGANHTFATSQWRAQVERATADWVLSR
jgi:exosortase A-associated hydrolase 1